MKTGHNGKYEPKLFVLIFQVYLDNSLNFINNIQTQQMKKKLVGQSVGWFYLAFKA